MAFTWTPPQIRWYENASDFSSFHKELALLLAPYLDPADVVCDWGCGLGRLSLELAPYASRIFCVDHDPLALQALGRQVERRGMDNISLVAADAGNCQLVCDFGLMSFFGTPYELMRHLMRQSRRMLVRIMNAGRADGGDRVDFIQDCLLRDGLPFERMDRELVLGQALTDLEDARRYVRFHWPDRAGEDLDRYLDTNLRETGCRKFPYYLGKQKKLAIFLVDTRAFR